ncbi:IS3 family transposase [Paenibacillus sp. S3N08]|uniref:IS3 family transposase n=1 Tax=Paenibacillus agricola TaxID=2716264 RepID=A0ABX0JHV9_9BACL|nr:IS3 family transposase [Paenibacillus agricola]
MHVSGIQQTIGSIQRQRQPLSQSNLPGKRHLYRILLFASRKSESEIHQAIKEYIYIYNYQRFQAKLKQRGPIEYRHASGCLVFFFCLLDRGMTIPVVFL